MSPPPGQRDRAPSEPSPAKRLLPTPRVYSLAPQTPPSPRSPHPKPLPHPKGRTAPPHHNPYSPPSSQQPPASPLPSPHGPHTGGRYGVKPAGGAAGWRLTAAQGGGARPRPPPLPRAPPVRLTRHRRRRLRAALCLRAAGGAGKCSPAAPPRESAVAEMAGPGRQIHRDLGFLPPRSSPALLPQRPKLQVGKENSQKDGSCSRLSRHGTTTAATGVFLPSVKHKERKVFLYFSVDTQGMNSTVF